MTTTHRTGNEWIAGLDRKPGFGADFAAEDIIDAPCWIPRGSVMSYESYAFSHDFRPGTWGGDKYD